MGRSGPYSRDFIIIISRSAGLCKLVKSMSTTSGCGGFKRLVFKRISGYFRIYVWRAEED